MLMREGRSYIVKKIKIKEGDKMTKNRKPRQRTNSTGDYFLITFIIIVSILFFASSKIWS